MVWHIRNPRKLPFTAEFREVAVSLKYVNLIFRQLLFKNVIKKETYFLRMPVQLYPTLTIVIVAFGNQRFS